MDEQVASKELTPTPDVQVVFRDGDLPGARTAPPIPLRNALAPDTASAPVPEQRSSHVNASKLASEKVVVAAPLSFAGSAARIWKLTGLAANPGARIALGVVAIALIALAWVLVLAWYLAWGVLLVPYRLIRRGSRKRKREALMHREQLAAIESLKHPAD